MIIKKNKKQHYKVHCIYEGGWGYDMNRGKLGTVRIPQSINDIHLIKT